MARHDFASWLTRRLLAAAGDPPVALRLWMGRVVTTASEPVVATFAIDAPSTLLRFVLDPQLQFGQLYAEGRMRLVQGDLVAALTMIFRLGRGGGGAEPLPARLAALLRRARPNTPAGSRRNVHAHYDIGNDFYRLWLDPGLAYTCAYFETPAMALEAAQRAKFDLVCRKLRLRPGDEVIAAGCGWGGFALHAAAHYGVRVRAYNISVEQLALARERAAQTGLADRVQFIEDDYRNITGSCDAFVSIGMLEHVGVENYPLLGRLVARLLRPAGCGLIYSIGRLDPRPMNAWMQRHIFPGARIPSLSEMTRLFEPAGLAVHDVENLRPHYARTLALWRQAFDAHEAEVERMYDARFVRLWRLYLAGSEAGFRSGEMQLFQVLFAPPDSQRVPETRADLYRDQGGG